MATRIFEISIFASILYLANFGICQGKANNDLCRTGKRQSPIDLVPANSELLEVAPTWKVEGLSQKPFRVEMRFYELNIRKYYDWGENPTPTLKSPLLSSTYILDYIEYHWAKEGNGSCHTINGRRYPMEAHAVWHNEKYGNLEIASMKEDGAVVVAIMVDMVDSEFSTMTAEADAVKNAKKPGDRAEVIGLPLLYLPGTLEYYAYNGSMLQEPCSEVVSWFILTEPLTVTPAELAIFQNTPVGERESVYARPPQPLNGRKVIHVRLPKS